MGGLLGTESPAEEPGSSKCGSFSLAELLPAAKESLSPAAGIVEQCPCARSSPPLLLGLQLTRSWEGLKVAPPEASRLRFSEGSHC